MPWSFPIRTANDLVEYNDNEANCPLRIRRGILPVTPCTSKPRWLKDLDASLLSGEAIRPCGHVYLTDESLLQTAIYLSEVSFEEEGRVLALTATYRNQFLGPLADEVHKLDLQRRDRLRTRRGSIAPYGRRRRGVVLPRVEPYMGRALAVDMNGRVMG